jgi:hypothetical protein
MAESEIPADILATAERIALAFNSLAQECLILDKPPAEAVSFGATHIAQALLAERERAAVIAEQRGTFVGNCMSRDVDVAMQSAAKEDMAIEIAAAIRQDNPNET